MRPESEYLWNPAATPDEEIVRLERALAKFHGEVRPLALPGARKPRLALRWKFAAGLAVAAGGAFVAVLLGARAPWSVELIAGNARRDGIPVTSGTRLSGGERLETDRSSTLRVAVGRVGLADLAPNSTLQVLNTGASEHRLRLQRGTLHVSVWAPPRFFVVEAPSFTAVDLGCVYSMRVDEGGASRLGVRQGEVEVQATGRSVLVTAGTVVEFDSAGHPSVPYPVESSAAWRGQLTAVAQGDESDSLLTRLLRSPRGAATISLWHLAWRVSPAARMRIYDALVPLTPTGAAVRREDIARLDPTAMEQWRLALAPLWSVGPASWWQRALLRWGFRKPTVRVDLNDDGARP